MKIAIAGYGIEGVSNYNHFLAGNDLTIVDEQETPSLQLPAGAQTILGKGSFAQLEDFDMVVRTASLNPHKIKTNGTIWSGTNEFFAKCPAPIIGVTASKGKGTTCSFIASILEAAGKKVHLVGNIGVPALDILPNVSPEDIVVYELSSFQLWDIKKSPHVAVLGMLEPDHLDVHANFAEYIEAKAQITRWQTAQDTLVYNSANEHSKKIAQNSLAQKLPYPDETGTYVADGHFWMQDVKLCSTKEVKLPGAHNLANACAAIAAAWRYVQDPQSIAQGLQSFHGLPHRLKFVREVAGVKYYDDSIATTPGSAIAAIQAFKEPKVLILGGSSKGADFQGVTKKLLQADIRQVLLIGQEAPRLATAFEQAGFTAFKQLKEVSMEQIVHEARSIAQTRDVVILSPSCASFDMFKDYKDRGNQFITAVQSL